MRGRRLEFVKDRLCAAAGRDELRDHHAVFRSRQLVVCQAYHHSRHHAQRVAGALERRLPRNELFAPCVSQHLADLDAMVVFRAAVNTTEHGTIIASDRGFCLQWIVGRAVVVLPQFDSRRDELADLADREHRLVPLA